MEHPTTEHPTTEPTKVQQFQAAFNKHAAGIFKDRSYIFALRDELQWPDHEFDRFLDAQMVAGALAGSSDYPKWFTEDHFKRFFPGTDDWLYMAVYQRKPLISVEVQP